MYCPKCASDLEDAVSYCRRCGADVRLLAAALEGQVLPSPPHAANSVFGIGVFTLAGVAFLALPVAMGFETAWRAFLLLGGLCWLAAAASLWVFLFAPPSYGRFRNELAQTGTGLAGLYAGALLIFFGLASDSRPESWYVTGGVCAALSATVLVKSLYDMAQPRLRRQADSEDEDDEDDDDEDEDEDESEDPPPRRLAAPPSAVGARTTAELPGESATRPMPDRDRS